MEWREGGRGLAIDHHSRNGGETFANENCPLGRAFEHFFKCSGFLQEVCDNN